MAVRMSAPFHYDDPAAPHSRKVRQVPAGARGAVVGLDVHHMGWAWVDLGPDHGGRHFLPSTLFELVL